MAYVFVSPKLDYLEVAYLENDAVSRTPAVGDRVRLTKNVRTGIYRSTATRLYQTFVRTSFENNQTFPLVILASNVDGKIGNLIRGEANINDFKSTRQGSKFDFTVTEVDNFVKNVDDEVPV